MEQPLVSLKLNQKMMPWLVGILLLMQVIFPYRGWVILLMGLGGLWAICYLWARLLARHLFLTREMRFGWAHVGDILEERFTLTNTGDVPALWVEVIDETTMPDYYTSRVTGVDGRSRNRWQTKGSCSRRGIFTLGPTTLRTGDPFGLYTVTLHQPQASTLTVTPPIVPLPTIEVAAGGRVGEGRSRPNAFERTVSSTGVRPYVPGDSLSRIHWPTTARRNEFFVRQFDSTPSGDWWIFLDMEAAVQVGQGYNSTDEHSVILTASLADRGLRLGRQVGLVTHGEALVWIPPQDGNEQRQKILRALALVSTGPVTLADLLNRSRSTPLASLIVITANPHSDWIEALMPLMQRGAIPTILLLDPRSFGGSHAVTATEQTLSQLGVAHTIITRDLLDRPEARPGQTGHWEWRVSLSGRAIATHRPKDMNWKTLQ